MIIKYIQKTTLLDYPEHIASTIFVGGCNFNCDFCYNTELIPTEQEPVLSTGEAIEFLISRQHLINHVVITGGEPTIQKDLVFFMEQLKKEGFKVKLDTNGQRSEVLQTLVDRRLVDYIAMDIKATLDKYEEVARAPINKYEILKSMAIILNSPIDHEFRTTIYKGMLTEDDFVSIFKLIEGANNYYIQNFFKTEMNSDHEPETSSFIQRILFLSQDYNIGEVGLRGDWIS